MDARLSPVLPIFLFGLLSIFWFVALNYELFFRRVGHEALQRNSADVPGLFLYIYRATVETSFFVIVFLLTTLRLVRKDAVGYLRYRNLLVAYLVSFFVFFAANSRMQFVLLLLTLICTQPTVANFVFRRIKLFRLALLLGALVLGLTLTRELYAEHNERIVTDDIGQLLSTAGWLIAARLDAVSILNRLQDVGFDPWGFDFGGVAHVLNFYASFVVDPAAYAAIKESLVTSPSVEIVNRLLKVDEIDFPKAMILDTFLSFGVSGLVLSAAFLGWAISAIQRQLRSARGFRFGFLLALFLLPMLLEFEKEFLGFFFSALKWAPFLLLVYALRPRVRKPRTTMHTVVAPSAVPLAAGIPQLPGAA